MELMAKEICDFLNNNKIIYHCFEHEPVYTVEDVKNAKLEIPGIPTKNLFLKDNKKNFFLLVTHEDKKINLKDICQIIKCRNLTFATENELKTILGLEMGDVGPLGIINDVENKTTLLLERNLETKTDINLSANSLTTTIALDYEELVKFIKLVGNRYIIIDI